MKIAGWLILILWLAVMLIPFSAGAECTHENLGTREELTDIAYSSVDEYGHNKQGNLITVSYCMDCGAEIDRTESGEPSIYYEAHSYADKDMAVTSQTCEQCGHLNECTHEYFESGYSWKGEVTYTDTDSNVRHLISGAAFLYERCQNCGVWKNVQSVENYSVEDIHSYDVDGKCLNCKHQNTCGHENAKIIKSIYDFTTAECEPIENDNYHHLATGTGCEGTYCEDCETYFNTREHIEVSVEALHSYVDGVCEECGHICTHDFDENGYCKACQYSCPHHFINGVCDICNMACSHPYYQDGYCGICGCLCAHVNRQLVTDDLSTEYEWVNTEKHAVLTLLKTHYECETCSMKETQRQSVERVEEDHLDYDEDGICDICHFLIQGGQDSNWDWNYMSGARSVLTITGSGKIPNYAYGEVPWKEYSNSLDEIVISSGITSIGANAFAGITPDHPVRVNFMQGFMPEIDEDAFSGTTAVFRHFYSNESWPADGTQGSSTWIYLPFYRDDLDDFTTVVYFERGWAVRDYNYSVTTDILLDSLAQALEITWTGRTVDLDYRPSDADWTKLVNNLAGTSTLVFYSGCTGRLNLSCSQETVSFDIEVASPGLNLTVTDTSQSGDGIYRLVMEGGTVNYTGSIQTLILRSAFCESDGSSLTVNGQVGQVDFYGDTQSGTDYNGSLTVNGKILKGFEYGDIEMSIPNITGPAVFNDMVLAHFEDIQQDDPVIVAGELDIEGVVPVSGLTYDMFAFEYRLVSDGWYLELREKEGSETGSFYGAPAIALFQYKPDFSVEDIYWDENTTIHIWNPGEQGKVVLNGWQKDGVDMEVKNILVEGGTVEINCPVNDLVLLRNYLLNEPCVVTINNRVTCLNMTLYKTSGNLVQLGPDGSVEDVGIWNRSTNDLRYFGPVQALPNGRELLSGSQLTVMSWRSGEETRAIMPADDEMRAAVGEQDADVVLDVADSSMEDMIGTEEYEVFSDYLEENNLSVGNVVSVFDATVTAFSSDESGRVTEREITVLNNPVEVIVNNPLDTSCYIVRIHEDEENNITVVPVSEETEEAEIPFSSDLFSKYAIIASHMETDPCVHEDLDGDGYCDQCGVKMEWAYDISSTGVLTISGAGATDDYTEASELPWYNDLYRISRVIIEEGITRIGDHVLDGLNGMARVDFCQTVKPTVSETAFGTSNVKCRYYSTNASWTDAPEEWVFLPTGEPLDDSNYHVAYDADGWHVYISQPYKEYSGLTAAQAAEMSYRNQNGTLYALPPEEEFWTVFTSGGVTFIGKEDEDQQYTLTVPDNRVLELSIRNPKLELTINDTVVGGGNIGLTVGDGTTVYYGTLCSLNLNGMTAYAYVGITGDLNSLSMNAPGSQDAPLGTVNIGGKIVNGSVYGTCDLVIPGISEPIPLGSVVTGSIADTDINGNFIVDGELLKPLEIAKSPTVDDYKLEYRRIEGKWNLSAEPKGNGSFASAYDLESIDPTFGITKLYWSPDTRLTINSDETITVSGRTAEERGEDVVDLANVTIYRGNITVNCPVGSVHIPSTFYGSTEPIALSIGGAVEELNFNLTHPDSRIFLTGGSINGGEWGRPFGYNRTFGAASGESVLFADGTLGVLSARSGQTMQAILPDNTTLADAMPDDNPLGEGEKVLMDVSEGNISDVVSDAECMAALWELGIVEEDIVSAFDVSLCTYTEQGGSVQEGRPVENLKDSVSVTVTNTTAENVCIVRLHEENDAVTADQLTEFSTEPTQPFESDKFSKYLLVKNNETVDPDMLDTLRLPAGLTKIEANAFEGGAFEAVIVPDGCTEIGAEAFKDCHNLVFFSYPAEMTIDPSAFDGCNVKVWDLRNITQ